MHIHSGGQEITVVCVHASLCACGHAVSVIDSTLKHMDFNHILAVSHVCGTYFLGNSSTVMIYYYLDSFLKDNILSQ